MSIDEEILENMEQESTEPDQEEYIPKISYPKLFRYATKVEIALVILGLIVSAASGTAFPISMLYFSDIIDNILGPTDKLLDIVRDKVIIYSILGCIALILGFLQAYLLIYVAEKQIKRIRLLYFKSVLRQDVAWHERNSAGLIITQISNNLDQMEEGMGANLANFIRDMSLFLCGIIIAFTQSWKLTAVACAMMPIIAVVFTSLALIIQLYTKVELAAYGKASSIASEVLYSVRTVFAFGGESEASRRYEKELGTAQKAGIKKGTMLGAAVGMISLSIFSTVGVLFYYGVTLIVKENFKPGDVILVIMNLIYGSIAVGKSMPLMEVFLRAAGSASVIFATIERIPVIDSCGSGTQTNNFKGHIRFENVSFTFPQRKDVPVLKNFNLDITPAENLAIVGPSGSGKSTVIQLIQRHYDADEGQIFIDGVNIKEYDVSWLRSKFGVVSQEPVLFSGSIMKNMKMVDPNVSEADIIEATKLANAHTFISELPNGYKTLLGEGGSSISGGQKQRIAIARALIRKPPILLLDEATSALDTQSEVIVQAALEAASLERTVITIAHRLTTIRNAHRIVVMDRGEIKEMGNHDELIKKDGIYADMLKKSSDAAPEENPSLSKKVHKRVSKKLKQSVQINNSDLKSSHSDSDFSDSEDELGVEFYGGSYVTMRTLQMSRPETCHLIFGFAMAVISGIMEPAFALLYAETFDVFTITIITQAVPDRAGFIAGMMSMVGAIKLLSVFFQYFILAIAGERLTKRARKLLFEAILKQEIGWFDHQDNQCGRLTSRLSGEVPCLRKVSGERGGVIIEGIVLVIVSLILAFYFSWQLALANMAFFPALIMTGALQVRDMGSKVGLELVTGSEIVQESLSAHRTVASLGLQKYFYDEFETRSWASQGKKLRSRILYSLVNAISLGLQFFQNAAIFYLGADLIQKKEIGILEMFRSVAVVNFGAQGLGRAASFLPALNAATKTAKNIFATLDRASKLPVNVGDEPTESVKGEIEFRDVHFAYPTRKSVKALNGFNGTVSRRTNVAFVGQSGCGKSTCLQLVQRLYDTADMGPNSGIFLDNVNIRSLKPSWLRAQMSVVSQEPNLFDLTIRENIAYGDLSREIPMDEIINAAKDANIHDFIIDLPEGYETTIGFRGSLLSGGQKQRIAIARALVRNPRVLLLDEATSALDMESERVVQEALDKAMMTGNRTSLVVAHRLNTVESCDSIIVLQAGKTVESGSPSQLMAAKGAYYELHNIDSAVVEKKKK